MTQSLELLVKSQVIFHWFLPDSTLYPFWSPCITPTIVRSCYFAPSTRVVLQSSGSLIPSGICLCRLCHVTTINYEEKKRQKFYIKIARWWAILCSLTEKFDLDKRENFEGKFNFELELLLLKLFEYFRGHRDNLLFTSPLKQFHKNSVVRIIFWHFLIFVLVWKISDECAIKVKNFV